MVSRAGVVVALHVFVQLIGGAEIKTPPAGGALEEVATVIRAFHSDLKLRLEEVLDRRTQSLIRSPEGFTQELRRSLYRARAAARLDLLIAVSKKGSEPARFILPSDGLSVRARLEEDAAARALVEALALGGPRAVAEPGGESRTSSDLLRGVPFAAFPEAFFEEIVAAHGEEEPSPADLVIINVIGAGSESALLGGIRLSTLAEGIQKVLDRKWGPQGPRWSAFLAGKPPGSKDPFSIGPEAKVVSGDGQGVAVPGELASLIYKDGRVAWEGSGKDRRTSAAQPWSLQGEWLVLRDRHGAPAGGIGVHFAPPAPARGAALSEEETRQANRLAEWATAALIGSLIALFAWLLLKPRWHASSHGRRKRTGALAQAREELSSELRIAAQKFSDPVHLGPILERAIEHAVARAGGTLAGEIGERIAASIASRIPRAEDLPRPPAVSSPPESSRVDVVSRAVLGDSFPIAILAVDARLDVIAWNPAAERLWGAKAEERLGKSLDRLGFFGLEGELRGRARRAIETGVMEPSVRLSFDREQVRHIQLSVLPLQPGTRRPGEGPAAAADVPGPPPDGALLIAENVSEKIEHEIAAKILGQYQKALSASLPLPMVVVDAEGRVMSWNAAAENLFGVPEREALGKDIASIPPPSVEQSTLPFCTPDGTQKGTLYLYGKAAQTLDISDLAPAQGAPAGAATPAEPAGKAGAKTDQQPA